LAAAVGVDSYAEEQERGKTGGQETEKEGDEHSWRLE
jgi:hypothetical protein